MTASPLAWASIDELAEVVRAAVESGRREEIDAVVAPAKAAGEVGDRHHLQAGHAEPGQLWELARCRCPGAFDGEGADVQLVQHLSLEPGAAPARRQSSETPKGRSFPRGHADRPAESARPGPGRGSRRRQDGSGSAAPPRPRQRDRRSSHPARAPAAPELPGPARPRRPPRRAAVAGPRRESGRRLGHKLGPDRQASIPGGVAQGGLLAGGNGSSRPRRDHQLAAACL